MTPAVEQRLLDPGYFGEAGIAFQLAELARHVDLRKRPRGLVEKLEAKAADCKVAQPLGRNT